MTKANGEASSHRNNKGLVIRKDTEGVTHKDVVAVHFLATNISSTSTTDW